jgi:hypothetical protein
MNPDQFGLRFENGLWLGAIQSQFGLVDVVLGGGAAAPDSAQLAALQRFQSDLDRNILRLHHQLRFRLLYRPIRIAVNTENRVGVQFRNWVTGNQSNLILEQPQGNDLRAVPGAMSFSIDGKIAYNLLTPHMKQFMGRCVGAIKKSGIPARGTGQFSIVVGDKQAELMLDEFYAPDGNADVLDRVITKARAIVNEA